MNVELLEQKEKLFAEYRNKITELEATRKQAKDFADVFRACENQIDKLERELGSMQKLIDYMIRYDLDPVSAKLKYDEEYEDKLKLKTFHNPVYSIGAAAMASTGGGMRFSSGATSVYPQNSAGIVATTIDDLFKDSNKYDNLWLDH